MYQLLLRRDILRRIINARKNLRMPDDQTAGIAAPDADHALSAYIEVCEQTFEKSEIDGSRYHSSELSQFRYDRFICNQDEGPVFGIGQGCGKNDLIFRVFLKQRKRFHIRDISGDPRQFAAIQHAAFRIVIIMTENFREIIGQKFHSSIFYISLN
jgi:hypothetical protein